MTVPEGGDAAPDPVPGLEHHHLHAEGLELLGRGQAGNAGTNDHHHLQAGVKILLLGAYLLRPIPSPTHTKNPGYSFAKETELVD